MIKIKNWVTGSIIFESEHACSMSVVQGMVQRRISLRLADLRGAGLNYLDLQGADFTDSNLDGAIFDESLLRGANFKGASMCGTTYNGHYMSIQPIFIEPMRWPVMVVDSAIKIGCQMHSIEAWNSFTDDEIDAMDKAAMYFWTLHKGRIMKEAIAHSADALAARQSLERRIPNIC